MERRERNQKPDMTRLLLIVIAVLAVILVTVIVIAVIVQNGQKPPAGTGSEGSSSSVPSSSVEIGLTVDPIAEEDKITMEDHIIISGTSDPAHPLTVNGSAIARSEDGSFQYKAALSLGKNEIVIAHKDDTETLRVERRYVVQKFSPVGDQTYGSGATVHFEVFARTGSQVTAQFNGQTIALTQSGNQLGSGALEGFTLYVGSYKLTTINTSDLQLGVVTFTATCDAITETYTSGNIICQKAPNLLGSDPSVTPSYGDYINVGSGYIVEILNYSAETFDGDTRDDHSHPTNCYLPKGTVDYCSTQLVENGKLKYVLMRCGRRVYLDKKNIPSSKRTQVADCYAGKLPDHNEIGVVSMEETGKHTVLTLDCLWKAPFYFDIKPQTYAYPDAGANRSYEITSFTATYVDITFCYATVFTGTVEIPEGNPLFKSAELIRRDSDCTLRLYLKKTGGFYGWDSYYNDNGQLCFRFLNPAVVSAADNAFGANLSGVTIMLDVGHGGVDGGAVGKLDGVQVEEADRNLALAKELKEQLESMGATVVLNRDRDVAITVDERIQALKQEAPDLCIAVHHNSISGYPNFGGFETYYYNPWSKLVTQAIFDNTKEAGVYNRSIISWHNYFVARQTCCPVVLTENGYVTHQFDLNNMVDEDAVEKKARAIAQGVADYFLAIQ